MRERVHIALFHLLEILSLTIPKNDLEMSNPLYLEHLS